LLSFSTDAISQVRVKGYYRKDGTYVRPHVRSNPDGNFYNNWSTKGNVNPYTGEEGTKTTPRSSYSSSAGKNYSSGSKSSYSSSNSYTSNNSTYNSSGSSENNASRETTWSKSTERPKGSIQYSGQANSGSIKMTYFEKEGLRFEETFSIKNETGHNINSINIRLIYKLENEEIIDYRDFVLNAPIPNGLSKIFTVSSFDQSLRFVYKYGNGDKSIYTPFIVYCQILGYN
jgi:hypothetical protein